MTEITISSRATPRDLIQRVVARLTSRRRRARMLAKPFYRRYPYTHPVSLFEVNRRVFISDELGVLFNGIGKAGHSSVLVNLARAQYGEDLDVLWTKGRAFKKPSQLMAEQVDALDDYFKFTLVRNPYTRTLSAYLDKVARNKVVPERLARATRGRAPSFLDFCLYLEDGGLNDAVHWSPQTCQLALPVASFDKICKLERFNEDMQFVLQQIAQSGRVTAFEIGKYDSHRTDSDRKRQEYYCDRTRAIVARLMADDFRLLGYSPE